MPYQSQVGDTWRITMAAVYTDGQVQETGFDLAIVVPSGGDTRLLMLTQINTDYSASINPFMPNTMTYIGCRASYRKPLPPWQPAIQKVNQVGSGGPETVPTQARPVIRLITEKVGPSYRGRLFTFSPATAAVTADGKPLGALESAWEGILNKWKNGVAIAGDTWALVLFHYQKKGDPKIPNDAITAARGASKFGTQRRSGQYGQLNNPPW